MGVGAKNKGYIKNKDTGEVRKFMYNPSSISDSRVVNFSEINSPGGSYPKFQYVNSGARTFTLELFLCNTASGETVTDYLNFLEKFLPSGTRFKKPPVMIVVMGSDVRECLLSQLDRNITDYNQSLVPTKASVSLALTQLK